MGRVYHPRTTLYCACFLAALGFAQWEERRRAPHPTLDTQTTTILFTYAHDEMTKLVILIADGKRIEASA